jgi:hypothetical protein
VILGFFTLSTIFDERRRPEGPPAAALITVPLKNPLVCPGVPHRGPEAGSPHICDFHGSGVNSESSCPFPQTSYNRYPLASALPQHGGDMMPPYYLHRICEPLLSKVVKN